MEAAGQFQGQTTSPLQSELRCLAEEADYIHLLLKGSCQLTPAFPGTQALGELIIDP